MILFREKHRIFLNTLQKSLQPIYVLMSPSNRGLYNPSIAIKVLQELGVVKLKK